MTNVPAVAEPAKIGRDVAIPELRLGGRECGSSPRNTLRAGTCLRTASAAGAACCSRRLAFRANLGAARTKMFVALFRPALFQENGFAILRELEQGIRIVVSNALGPPSAIPAPGSGSRSAVSQTI